MKEISREDLFNAICEQFPELDTDHVERIVERFIDSAKYCEKCDAWFAMVSECPKCTGLIANLEVDNSGFSLN